MTKRQGNKQMNTITSKAVNTAGNRTGSNRGRKPTNQTFTIDEIQNAVHVDIRHNADTDKYQYFLGGHMVDDGFGELVYVAGNQYVGESIHKTFVPHNIKRGRLARFDGKTACIHNEFNGTMLYVKKIEK